MGIHISGKGGLDIKVEPSYLSYPPKQSESTFIVKHDEVFQLSCQTTDNNV